MERLDREGLFNWHSKDTVVCTLCVETLKVLIVYYFSFFLFLTVL